MATLNQKELKNFVTVLSAVRGAFNSLFRFDTMNRPKPGDANYLYYLEACRDFAEKFTNPYAENLPMKALQSYEELDAELLAAQETIADLENTLEDANRDLTALLKRIEARKVDGYTPIVIPE